MFSDVKNLTRNYFHRLQTYLQQLPPVLPQASSSSSSSSSSASSSAANAHKRSHHEHDPTAVSSSSSSSSSSSAAAVAEVAAQQAQAKKRKELNTSGHAYTPLALVLATPPPGVFSCFGKILSWYPKTVAQ